MAYAQASPSASACTWDRPPKGRYRTLTIHGTSGVFQTENQQVSSPPKLAGRSAERVHHLGKKAGCCRFLP